MLAPGDKAPRDVVIVDEQAQPASLADYAGRYVVVYFYPRDLTPGCTIEAEEFRDKAEEFRSLNAIVVGVSKDTCASHQKFIAKKELTFTLWSDAEHKLMDAFGTWGERKFMGRTYMGTARSTFLVGPDGVIVHVWESVKPLGHAEEVLAHLRSLTA